jgi:hypothetical protein
LESHAAREESYLLERVKVLLSEKRWVAAIDVASGLANRLSLSRPAVSAHLRVLEAAGAWQARDRQRAIEALHLADATHPAGKIDLMSDPEVLFWLDGLTASEWRRSRKR